MWSQPATAKQISALEAHGNHDGKYYSKGRAGQTIGESSRAADTNGSARAPGVSSPRSRSTLRPSGYSVQQQSGSLLPALSAVEDLVALQLSPVDTESERVLLTGEMVNKEGYDVRKVSTALDRAHRELLTDVRPYSFLAELEERHLRDYQSRYGNYAPDAVLGLVKQWTETKTSVAMMLAQARVDVVAILREAPAVSSPESVADSLLGNAFSSALEERHLSSYLSKYGMYAPDAVLAQIQQWAATRIEVATKLARTQVNLARTFAPPVRDQRAIEPSSRGSTDDTGAGELRPTVSSARVPTRGDGPACAKRIPPRKGGDKRPSKQGARYLGTVVRVKPAHGAIVSLAPGMEGWLHISKLRVLNGGKYVESVESVLQEGEKVWVRVIGADEKGKPRLALASPNHTTRKKADPAGHAPATEDQPPAATTKLGFLARLAGQWHTQRQHTLAPQASGGERWPRLTDERTPRKP